ncbi:prostaglandin E2 receptor EP4 subtype-like [Saccostrea echinata]|uniref:prostaglandin E2 receptor EP4 subtype-like n=1 Tax=Saccostrea echinata TaxID=191078 RepID=UPI002A80BF6B|nr:prostaglandin E2 receptor EP4 subtype-like [Saccostrea echinata]
MSQNISYCDSNFTNTGHGFTVASGFYIVLGVLGNVTAFVLLIKQSRYHNWKMFYRLVLLLVSVDLLGVVMFGSISVIENTATKWLGGKGLCIAESIIIIFISLTNLLIVTIISLERFLALWHPYFYSTLKHHACIIFVPVVILCVAVVMAILPAVSGDHFEKIYPCDFCFINIYGNNHSDYIYAFIYSIFGLLFLTLAIVLNILVIVALSRSSRGYSRQRQSLISINHDGKEYYFMLFQLLAVITELAVCWSPLLIKIIMTVTLNVEDYDEALLKKNYLFFRFAAWVLVLDPLIYVILRREIIVNICLFCKRREHQHLTSSGDKVDRGSMHSNPNRASYGTI